MSRDIEFSRSELNMVLFALNGLKGGELHEKSLNDLIEKLKCEDDKFE